jgi:hypothetical protein
MGTCTSRNTFQKNPRIKSSNQISDEQYFNQPHMDSHYIVMDKILNDHLTLIHSDTNTKQAAMNIHKTALNIAARHHRNAAYMNNPNYQRTEQMIYTV